MQEPQKFDHEKTNKQDESHNEKEEEPKKQNDTKNGEKEEIPFLDQRLDIVLVKFFGKATFKKINNGSY